MTPDTEKVLCKCCYKNNHYCLVNYVTYIIKLDSYYNIVVKNSGALYPNSTSATTMWLGKVFNLYRPQNTHLLIEVNYANLIDCSGD